MKCPECNGVGYKKISATSCAICERCGGMGEVKETNFDRITKTPEALAKFIAEDRKECHSAICMEGLCDGCTKEGVLKWLKQEKKQ